MPIKLAYLNKMIIELSTVCTNPFYQVGGRVTLNDNGIGQLEMTERAAR